MAETELWKLGMDPMERLYYERKGRRKKAYEGKQRKALSGRGRQPAGSWRAGRAVVAAPAQEVPCPVCVMEGVCQ